VKENGKSKDCVPKEHRQALNAGMATFLLEMHAMPDYFEWNQKLRQPEEHREDLDWLFGEHLERVQGRFNNLVEMQPGREYVIDETTGTPTILRTIKDNGRSS
jgi:hypothetical protein